LILELHHHIEVQVQVITVSLLILEVQVIGTYNLKSYGNLPPYLILELHHHIEVQVQVIRIHSGLFLKLQQQWQGCQKLLVVPRPAVRVQFVRPKISAAAKNILCRQKIESIVFRDQINS
jgi:hypothetical protein